MPGWRCVVQDCGNRKDEELGISIHNSPASGSALQKWKRFVSMHRKNFNPAGRFAVCSEHFTADCFTLAFPMKGMKRNIKTGCFPTIWKKTAATLSERGRRTVLNELLADQGRDEVMEEEISTEVEEGAISVQRSSEAEEIIDAITASASTAQVERISTTEQVPVVEVIPDTECCTNSENETGEVYVHAELAPTPMCILDDERAPENQGDEITDVEVVPKDTQETDVVTRMAGSQKTPEHELVTKTIAAENCMTCKVLRSEVTQLKAKVTRLKNKIACNQEQWVEMFRSTQGQSKLMVNAGTQTDASTVTTDTMESATDIKLQDEADDDDDDMQVDEYSDTDIPKDDEDPTWSPQQIDEEYSKLNEDDASDESKKNPRLDIEEKNIREEPKGIVFISKLLLLFQFCHLCFFSNPKVSVAQTGTMLTVCTSCSKCGGSKLWRSQPDLLGKFPAGNLLLSFAVLCAGASIRKVLLVFKHMGVLAYHEPTYYYHQRHLLIPSIVSYWRKYQSKLLERLRDKEVVLAGDGRHDSMGHSAKFGTYTMFCCTVGLIIHIVLVQANQAGNSSGMEFLAFEKAFTFLLGTGMLIKSFISDRHASIAKWMREDCPKKCRDIGKPVVEHFFDLWHIGKKIQKVLTKLSKEKNCEIIGRWRKSCIRHFYWAVTSTKEHLGEVKLAKFQAFLSHVINKHKDLPNRLFNACAHGNITSPRVWMSKASEAYEKLNTALSKSSLTKAIKKASSVEQTSALEGYHSVINQFAPKMYAYSYLGMLCRTILAALHFNYNLRRETKVDKDGNPVLRVTWPKFKEGEATVREAKVSANYDYVADIYETLTTSPRAELKLLEEELKGDVPDPLNTMLDKESKDEAISKYQARKEKVTVICPPTCPEEEIQVAERDSGTQTRQTSNSGRRPPHCSKCGKRRLGHKKGQCDTDNDQ